MAWYATSYSIHDYSRYVKMYFAHQATSGIIGSCLVGFLICIHSTADKHTSTFRSIDGNGSWEEWLAPARPLDTNHRYDAEEVDEMLRTIQENPPELPQDTPDESTCIIEAAVTDDTGEEEA